MLILKFWLNTGKGRIYIQEPAKDEDEWQDKDYVFLQNIMVEKRFIDGEIEKEYVQRDLGGSFTGYDGWKAYGE